MNQYIDVMVCLSSTEEPVMSTTHAREVVSTCNRGQARMQAVADLLLLTSDLRPVKTESLSVFGESYPKCRETIVTRTKGLLVLTGKINEQLHSVTAKWHDICVCLQDICELVVGLTECSAHAAYIIAISKPQCTPAVSGIIDQYKISRANVEIVLCCKQLHQATKEELPPAFLVQICSDINKNLTVLTECCKNASEQTEDENSQDQFKLCIKSFTSCASCLLSSIRCFKAQPTEVHLQRCLSFCEPLRASTQAVVNFATEEQFIGKPASLTQDSKEAKKSVLGKCHFCITNKFSPSTV